MTKQDQQNLINALVERRSKQLTSLERGSLLRLYLADYMCILNTFNAERLVQYFGQMTGEDYKYLS